MFVEVANRSKIPILACDEGSVEQGALIALSINYYNLGKQTAVLADSVLKGTSISSIGLVQYFGQDIIINKKESKELNYVFPQEILSSAKRIIQ